MLFAMLQSEQAEGKVVLHWVCSAAAGVCWAAAAGGGGGGGGLRQM